MRKTHVMHIHRQPREHPQRRRRAHENMEDEDGEDCRNMWQLQQLVH